MPLQIADEAAHRGAFHEVHARETLDPGCCFGSWQGCQPADTTRNRSRRQATLGADS